MPLPTIPTTTTSARFSAVTEYPAAIPDAAERHFVAKLAVETDVSDVAHDLAAGTGPIVVIDVRLPTDYELCRVRGAINIPHRRIDGGTTAELPRDATLVTYCWGPGCNAATKAALRLARLGFRVKEMIGGLEYWRLEGCPVDGALGVAAPLHWQHRG